MASKRTYITTPIYYVNAAPHIGTALTMLVCDMATRYRKMRGEDAVFLTGTDENGPKVYESAVKAGREAKPFVDEVSQKFRDVFEALHYDYFDFIRTTEPRHVRAVQTFFEILREKGLVYEGLYEGWYDVSSETFYKESELVDGKSPDGNPVQRVSETNWFFKLSDFGDRLLEHIESNPQFLLPESRRNEAVSFIKQGLRDMAISRKTNGWGIPVPGDSDQVFYVWFDALISYLTATGWPDEGWQELWPADIHWMAKEIFTRFHATLWPAMLMGAELPLPQTVIAHGWFVFGDAKMSKSLGNVIYPLELIDEIIAKTGCEREIAIDVVRFSLARLLPYDGDTSYTREEVDKHYNADLANDLGNALNRSLSMAHKFLAPAVVPDGSVEPEMKDRILLAVQEFESAMETLRIDAAMESVLGLVRYLNKYIDTRAPWALAKANDPALPSVLLSMLHALRTSEGLIRPVMPHTADQIAHQLGAEPLTDWDRLASDDVLVKGTPLGQPKPLFPRIDLKKMNETPAAPAPTPAPAAPAKPEVAEIDIKEFMKVQLRVARVLEAEPLENSEKLIKLQVMIGEEKRQILAGIKKSYNPMDLVGRQIIVVANLKTAKLAGHESQGMVLAADGPDGTAILLQPEAEAPEGASVH